MEEQYETVNLTYSIYKYSSYSANYLPENIMVNNPTDPLSRWFTDSNTPAQFIMLRLHSSAIVETIEFGKFVKSHVSDLKRFQVFGGMDENNLSLLLTGGLKKDSTPEIFRLRHRTQEGLYLPVRYIKIVPLQSWGPAYNYTIWFVELKGKNHEDLLTNAIDSISLRKEEEAVRILLKHLRRRRYKDAFEALSRESGVQLEGHTQAKLWNALVENGDYKQAEEIFEEAVNDGELDWYLSWQPYRPQWRQLCACSLDVESRLWTVEGAPAPPRSPPQDLQCADRELRPVASETTSNGTEQSDVCDEPTDAGSCCSRPGPRGGHQMVVDSTTGTLYLFGGWNGSEDLDDLWSYNTSSERWTVLCRHSKNSGGPSPRSCHKMVFDPIERRLYTLGRYLDNAQRVPANMNSELHSYCVASGRWEVVCSDTASAGGPRLVFDHQMCIDADARTLYVFGGRVLPANTEESVSPQYSGLYAYYIASNTWQQLLPDHHALDAPQPRVSHSMLFHPVQRRLYIFAGQRNKEHLLDLWWWDVNTGECRALCQASAVFPPPADGFTQRATLDPDTDEIFVLSGMSKERDKRVYNTLWMFSLKRASWTCVYRNESIAPDEPKPRFAHQFVYDPVKKVHYLSGGNPGCLARPRLRLDDMWSLRLTRGAGAASSVVREARAALREACYRELARANCPMPALHYLRNDLAAALDANDPAEVSRFHSLATVLFAGAPSYEDVPRALSPPLRRALARRRALRPARPDLARALAQVLGADDSEPDPPQPWEDVASPVPETWDVGPEPDEVGVDRQWAERHERMHLYDRLCRYFRPSAVPPPGNVSDLVSL